jgi:hypothetical protein
MTKFPEKVQAIGRDIFLCSHWPSESQKENFDEKLKFEGEDYLMTSTMNSRKHLHKILKSILLHKVIKHKQADFN